MISKEQMERLEEELIDRFKEAIFPPKGEFEVDSEAEYEAQIASEARAKALDEAADVLEKLWGNFTQEEVIRVAHKHFYGAEVSRAMKSAVDMATAAILTLKEKKL